MKRDLYAEVTARILAELETGAAPWVKPWSQTPGRNVPMNAVTQRPYSGCNVVLLWIAKSAGWAAPHFLTFKQAKDAGGSVRKGEKGIAVYFVKRLDFKDPDARDGEVSSKDRSVFMMREYHVFNIAQCDGLPEKLTTRDMQPVKVRNPDERDATIDEFMSATGADIRECVGEAYYAPGKDFVSLPAFIAFNGASNFYSTAFHELGHWTGHKSRCDRSEDWRNSRFGSHSYAAEELVAELTAAFLCAEFNLDGELRHAGYLGHWMAMMKADAKAFLTAASKAQKAADYMRALALKEPAPIDLAIAA